MELITLPIGELADAAKHSIEINIPLVVVGKPGLGKTSIFRDDVAGTSMHYTEMLLAGRDIGDVFMPYVTESQLHFHYNPCLPIEGSRYDDGKLVLLNIDEFSGAKPLMQNFLLKVLDERKVGEAKLLDTVRIVATGNRAWDLAHVEQLSAALGNRATFITVEEDLDAFLNYAIRKKLNPVMMAWVRFDPTYLMSFDPEQFLAGDPAFCSPRSNERLSKIQDAYDKGNMSDNVFRSLVCGTIGNKVGIKYVGFTKIRTEMTDVQALLAGNKANVKFPKSPEVVYAVIFSIAQNVDKQTLPNALWFVEQLQPEWQVMFSSAITGAKPHLIATNAWGTFASKIANF